MVLLHTMHACAGQFGWRLSLAHFNHRLRGRSSAADQRFVCAAAKRLKLPIDVAAADVRAAAAAQGISIEMAARQLRHEFLARCARRRGAKTVALAHHADDQIELFLLRLLRGAGGGGLAGMKTRNPSPTDRGVTLVRPLLDFSKEQIRSFAQEARLRFREDASNAALEFERNWVRRELLPLLRQRQPAVGQNILRTMEIVGAEAEFVSMIADSWRQRSPGRWSSPLELLPVAVQRRLVQEQIRELGVAADFQLVEELRTAKNRAVSVGPRLGLVCDEVGWVRRVETPPARFESAEKIVPLSGRGSKSGAGATRVLFAGRRFTWRVREVKKAFPPKRVAGRECFDADKVGRSLVLRHWRAGDRFQPIGLPCATKLQDWFTNRKVPAGRRRQLVLAETERGEVFWVEGERINESCKVTPATRRLLELSWGVV